MLDAILNRLDQVQREHKVRILYACESGSLAWGFASTDSDYDVRFIYARPASEYLRVDPLRDVIEQPIVDLIDLNGWDLFKAACLLRKSNPPLMEWIGSPIVYCEDAVFTTAFRQVAAEHFSLRACGEHYMSMTRRNHRGYIEGRDMVSRKKYLYTLRPIVCTLHLLEHHIFPPTSFVEGLDRVELPNDVRQWIDQLLVDKQAGVEMGKCPAVPFIHAYLQTAIDQLSEQVKQLPDRHFPAEPLNGLICRTLGN